MEKRKYAGVVVDQTHPSLDKLFHYGIPDNLAKHIQLGVRVQVPFGHRNLQGYILSLDEEPDVSMEKIRPIKKVLDPSPALVPSAIPLIYWMRNEYHCMFIEAIRCFIPPGLRLNIGEKTQKIVVLEEVDYIDEWIRAVERYSPGMAAILRTLEQNESMPYNELLDRTGASESSIQSLLKRGYIRIEVEETYRDPWPVNLTPTRPPEFTREQAAASQVIGKCIRQQKGKVLLRGVTGSGKTEIYMKAAEDALSRGRQVIVLVPEISLTPQTVSRFKGRFGDQVAILHSRLSLGERYDEWRRIRRNDVQIVVGARSAVFAPLERLGLVIIDEAHEDSYKSEVRPRYHTRDVAAKRCELDGAVLVLGSATPSLEDYDKAIKGEYQLVEIDTRIDNQAMPQVEIIDMRRELAMGNRSMISNELYRGLKHILSHGEQAILLINRRGYAHFVSCRSCGHVIKCRNCDVSLTYHIRDLALKCHYCGYREGYPKVCPVCGSKYIKHFGSGTQRIEEELCNLFPFARLLRMDMDTTGRKGAHYRILDAFHRQEYDILLGTQMVAKGLDFPNVTLVGVLAADSALYLPDYRSSEKTFQLITQVAGRAGRGSKSGRVIVQSYQPEHYALQYASNHDYKGFFHREVQIRRQFGYPPYSHIIRVLVTGEEEKKLKQFSETMVEWLGKRIADDRLLKEGLLDVGAYPAPIEKIKNKYRWQVLIRVQTDKLYRMAYHRLSEELNREFYSDNLNIALDFNPLSLV
ncbi:MAG: primosomal protein N' [Caldicoprobacterales bacterium]|nr:primosomal protein N' [Clostridiales bacterium]